MNKITTHFFQRKAKKAIHQLLCLFALLLITVQSSWGQQVIGEYPGFNGGFEGFSTGDLAANAAGLATGTTYSVYSVNTVAANHQAGINTNSLSSPTIATVPRSGSRVLVWGGSFTTKKLYSATVNTNGGIANATAYTVQYYYLTSRANNIGGTPNVAISPDGSVSPGTGVNMGTAFNITTTAWTKVQLTVTSGSSAASPKYGALVFSGANFSNTNSFFIDDLCVYAGTADNAAPTAASAATTTVVSSSALDVNWTGLVNAGDGGGYVIVRSTSATAVTLNANGIYAVGSLSATGGGSVVAIIPGVAGANIFADTGLASSTTYYYSIFAVDKAFNYAAAVTCNGTTPAPGLTPPTLTADTTSNNVDNDIDITFTDDATWRGTPTPVVKIGTTTLTAGTDYVLTAGNLQLKPSGGNTLLQTSGSKSVSIEVPGYQPATVTQIINPGAVVAVNSSATIGSALAPNTAQTITITAKDQYNNLVPGYNFIYDATITNANVTTGESYNIDGTPRTSTVNDSFVTAVTNASGVATFTVALPVFIDSNDGISIQVQLANGTTNVGSAFIYSQLPHQTITFGALATVTYGDANFNLTATASSGLTVTYASSNTAVATVSGNTVTITGAGTTNITASQAGNGSWAAATPVIQVLTVNQKALTVSGAVASNKVYDGTNPATITGATLVGVVGLDVVTVSGGGTFVSVNAGTGISVTAALSLGGANAGNYTLTQPTGLTANITKANQIITSFTTSLLNYEGFTNFTPLVISATSGTNPITFTSSNPDVAIVNGSNQIQYVGLGVTNITCSQAASSNYNATSNLTQILRVIPMPIATWNFHTTSSTATVSTKAATIFDAGLATASSANLITRGAGVQSASGGSGTSAYRAQGFLNTAPTAPDILGTSSTRYFQVTLQAANAGSTVSLSTIDGYFYDSSNGFNLSPGAVTQFAYSLDGGTTVVPIGSAVQSTAFRMGLIDVSGIAALQDVPSGTTVTLRFYATGYATNVGYGLGSPNPAAYGNVPTVLTDGLVIGGDVSDSTTWSGTAAGGSWSNGNPSATKNAIITGTFDTSISTGLGFTAKKLTINGSGSLTVKAGTTVTVQNQIINNAGANALIVENTGSLVQVNNYAPVNRGVIKYNRQTNAISNLDYTYWSSPVAGFTLGGVSPNTQPDKYYSFNSTLQSWKQESAATGMTPGVGYIIRGPQLSGYMSPNPPATYPATFSGVPNNGKYQISGIAANKAYLIGNPYASALDADAFIDGNLNVLKGTLYFWTHNTPVIGNVYDQGDYASYNRTGSIGTAATNPGVSNLAPTGKIASGQGFFANSLATLLNSDTTIDFSNAMRVGVGGITGNNSQFFKTNNTADSVEKHRIWLNLTNAQGAFKQTLVGYVTGATNEYDTIFDGESFNANQFVDFYSVNQSKNLSIQGRALPFDDNDIVPLGFKTTINGPFTISIDNTDGLLVDQDVYIEDLLTNTITDIKAGSYTFNTVPGTFNNRFILRYTNSTLGVNDPSLVKNGITVYKSNGTINVYATNALLDNVKVYDLQGRLITEQKDVNSTTTSLKNLRATQQVLIVKVTTQDNTVVTKKVVN